MQEMAILETEKYQKEGLISYGGKLGVTPIENPRGRSINTLNGTISATARRLGLAYAGAADRRSSTARAVMNREAAPSFPNEIDPSGPVTDDELLN